MAFHKKIFFAFPLLLLFGGSILEIYSRSLPRIQDQIAEKRAHCIDPEKPFIRLCPSVALVLKNQANKPFFLTTDTEGNRVVPGNRRRKECPDKIKEIWLLGDSIAMGYGLDDAFTPGAFLYAESGCPVKILAVDGSGALALEYFFSEQLRRETEPNRIYVRWIFHPSDFLDDPINADYEKNTIRSLARRFHFLLSSWSGAYIYLKRTFLQNDTDPNKHNRTAIIQIPEENHPTNLAARRMAELAKKADIDFAIVFFSNGDRNGLPAPYQRDILKTMERFKTWNIPIMDLKDVFLNYSDEERLYQIDDGHPSRAGAELLGKKIVENTLKKAENHQFLEKNH